MDRPAHPSLEQQFAAVQDWWRDAGVDSVYADDPRPWLSDEAPAAPAQQAATPPARSKQIEPPPLPTIGGGPAQWPKTLDEFTPWWLSEPSLDAGGTNPRIAPRGAEASALMVLVPQPEAEDRDALLSGPQGRLLASFLDAAGLAAGETYLATALPRHTPIADWPGLARAGLGAITLHHIALARPKRLLVFGNTILPLLGHDPPQSAQSLREVNHQGASVSALASWDLETLLERPAMRKIFWGRWLEWTDG